MHRVGISSAFRQSASDGPLTPEFEDALKKTGIVPEDWMFLLEGFERRFSRTVGGPESLGPILVRLGQNTARGIQLIRDAFSWRVVQVVARTTTKPKKDASRNRVLRYPRPRRTPFVPRVHSAGRSREIQVTGY